MMKKIFKAFSVVCLILTLSFLAAGCGDRSAAKEFKCDEGLSVTLNGYFKKSGNDSLTYMLESKDVIFTALKQIFQVGSGLTGDSTLTEYTEAVKASNAQISSVTVHEYDEDGVRFDYMYYSATVQNVSYSYMAVTLKGSDAFWLCNFACETKSYEAQKDNFLEWAKTIVVD